MGGSLASTASFPVARAHLLLHHAKMDAIKMQIVSQIATLEHAIVQWANPSLGGEDPPTKAWFACDLQTALSFAAGYLVLVAIGLLMKSQDKGWKERAAAAAKKSKPTVAQKFTDQPVNYIAAIYNPLQVALCGYMMWVAICAAVRF